MKVFLWVAVVLVLVAISAVVWATTRPPDICCVDYVTT